MNARILGFEVVLDSRRLMNLLRSEMFRNAGLLGANTEEITALATLSRPRSVLTAIASANMGENFITDALVTLCHTGRISLTLPSSRARKPANSFLVQC